MKFQTTWALPLVLLLVSGAAAADGMIATKSSMGAKETMDRFESVVKQKGMTVFLRVDHAAGAAKVDKKLRATELLVFGNPKGGTPLLECAQTSGIDLPLKALVWEDPAGQVWLGYNDPAFIAARHQAAQCSIVGAMTKTLAGFVKEALAK